METLFRIMFILVWVIYLYVQAHVQQIVEDVQAQMYVYNVLVHTKQQQQVHVNATLRSVN